MLSLKKTWLLALLFAFPASNSFAAVAISELIETQGSIISGDKMFDQFTYTSTGDMPPAEEVMVDPITDLSGNYGIRLFGAFLDHPGDGASEVMLNYRVSVLDPDRRISGATLQGNPTAIRAGSGVITASFGSQGQLQIIDEFPDNTQLVDSATFDEQLPELDVEVLLTAESLVEGENGAITVSFIDQTFSQSVVPEPGSLVVWMGMAFLVCVGPICVRRLKTAECHK